MKHNEDIQNAIKPLSHFIDSTQSILTQQAFQPEPESIAAEEIRAFARPGAIQTVHAQATLLLECVADNLGAFRKAGLAPMQSMAPFVSVRASLEAAALICWLFDKGIDANERVGRSLALRYHGLSEQLKYINVADRDQAQSVVSQVAKLKEYSRSLGYLIRKNKKKEVIGIHQVMPGMTYLISHWLHKDADYRLLSAIAHAQLWAVIQLSFSPVDLPEEAMTQIGKGPGQPMQKTLSPNLVRYLSRVGIESLHQSLMSIFLLFGWDTGKIDDLYQEAVIDLSA